MDDLLSTFRAHELDRALRWFPPPQAAPHVLEIGAGTGHQALKLVELGYSVTALDIASSPYRASAVFPVGLFNGSTIPAPDARFDVVFSSNVLEHVHDLDRVLAEVHRVLKPGGRTVHLMPTSAWRFWSFVSHVGWGAKRLHAMATRRVDARGELGRERPTPSYRSALASVVPRRHGEHGTALGELISYRRARWVRQLREAKLDHVGDEPTALFYTNALLLGESLSVDARGRLAQALGSACRIYCFERARDAGDTP